MQSLLGSDRFRAYIKGKPVGLFAACRGFYRNNLHEGFLKALVVT